MRYISLQRKQKQETWRARKFNVAEELCRELHVEYNGRPGSTRLLGFFLLVLSAVIEHHTFLSQDGKFNFL